MPTVTPEKLAQGAQRAAEKYGNALSRECHLKVELAHTAMWLYMQPDSERAAAAATACEAMRILYAQQNEAATAALARSAA